MTKWFFEKQVVNLKSVHCTKPVAEAKCPEIGFILFFQAFA